MQRPARQGVSKGGLIEIQGPDGTKRIATFTCCHCNRVFRVPEPGSDEMGFCTKCHARECIGCGKKNKCIPFEKKLKEWEDRDRFRRELGTAT